MSSSIDEKYERLRALIAAKGSVAVAFSGGVDSSFLCYVCAAVLRDKAIAITVANPMLPQSERDCARRVAAFCKITHYIVEETALEADVAANPPDRCYFCKKREFASIKKAAAEHGVAVVFDGSNADDGAAALDYRPGLRALAELSIESPLREAGLSKADIRELSRRFALETWDKPAFACLASRVPYGEAITLDKLRMIDAAEAELRSRGLRQFRVRSHALSGGGALARIEVAPAERERFFSAAMMDDTAQALKRCGFTWVALDLEGYTTGSMNRAIRRTT